MRRKLVRIPTELSRGAKALELIPAKLEDTGGEAGNPKTVF